MAFERVSGDLPFWSRLSKSLVLVIFIWFWFFLYDWQNSPLLIMMAAETKRIKLYSHTDNYVLIYIYSFVLHVIYVLSWYTLVAWMNSKLVFVIF